VLARLRSRGFSRGVVDGNRLWLVVGAAAWLLRGAQWAWRRQPEVVYVEELDAGETLVISRESGDAAKARVKARP
jgi:hypothetical protein